MVILVIMAAMLLEGMIYSVQGPFYPQEAEVKGLSPAQYGLVFGLYELSGFVFSIPLGFYMTKIGVKYLFVSGIFIIAGTTCVFGFLHFVENGMLFFFYSVLCRLMQSFSENSSMMAALFISSRLFPEHKGLLSGITETMFAVGMIIGPFCGSILYSVGGFMMPFEIFGILSAIVTILSFYLLPGDEDIKEEASKPYNVHCFKKPSIWLGFLGSFATGISLSFISGFLEPHVRSLNLSVTYTGILFLLNGLGYAIGLPLSGKLADKGFKPISLLIGSAITTISGFFLVGPFPYLHTSVSLSLLVPGLLLSGLGIGGQMTLSLIYLKEELLIVLGGTNSDSMAYGVWLSGFSLGAFLGPTLGGALFIAIGFRLITLGIIALNILLITFLIILSISRRGSLE